MKQTLHIPDMVDGWEDGDVVIALCGERPKLGVFTHQFGFIGAGQVNCLECLEKQRIREANDESWPGVRLTSDQMPSHGE
jgi:hypothetical protein